MAGSLIEIIYDGNDISDKVIFNSASFEMLANAQPGRFEFRVKDVSRTLSFTTGKEISLDVDGIRLWGGYLTSVSPTFAFPVVDTTDIGDVTARQFILRGMDYNILFDKLVLRQTTDYLHQIENFSRSRYDGDLLRNELFPKYLDLPSGLTATTANVEDVFKPGDPLNTGLSGTEAWMQQGTKFRDVVKDFAQLSGAVYYIDPSKNFIYRAIESSHAAWGFSDHPNNIAISIPIVPGRSTYGFRELNATEDGSALVNDALIWGGSEFAGPGGTVFAREENADSIALHGRWQLPEYHFGESGMGIQQGVDARAEVIVNGSPSALPFEDFTHGMRYPQWVIRLAWFSHDVPSYLGDKQHLRPGDLVTIQLYTMGASMTHPLILTLPLRSLRMTFPNLDAEGDAYIRFDGTFSLQLGDPFTLWYYLTQEGVLGAITPLSATEPGSSTSTYGSYFSTAPIPTPDGATTLFELPNDIGYIGGTTTVYINGLLQHRPTHYTESDPNGGEITFVSPPVSGDEVWIICRTT